MKLNSDFVLYHLFYSTIANDQAENEAFYKYFWLSDPGTN